MAQQLFHEYGLYPIHAAAAVATAAKFARAPDRGTERAGTVNPIPTCKKTYVKDLPRAESALV